MPARCYFSVFGFKCFKRFIWFNTDDCIIDCHATHSFYGAKRKHNAAIRTQTGGGSLGILFGIALDIVFVWQLQRTGIYLFHFLETIVEICFKKYRSFLSAECSAARYAVVAGQLPFAAVQF